MIFDTIFLTLFFLTWILLGLLAWLPLSLRRRAHGALWALPFALLGGAAGGALLPFLGLNDALGLGLSMIGAVLGGATLARAAFGVWDACALAPRFRRWAVPGAATGPGAAAGGQPAPSLDSPTSSPTAAQTPRDRGDPPRGADRDSESA